MRKILGGRNIMAVGESIYYGNNAKDMVEDIMAGSFATSRAGLG